MFISFEGGDGSGKTTVLKAIIEKLESAGVDFILTREPGGSNIAEKIRHVILDMNNVGMDARTEALLYAAARRQNIVDTVWPALAKGRCVISDRYVDSSWVYQGVGRGLGVAAVKQVNDWAIEGLLPNRTYYLDVAPEVAQHRIASGRSNEVNRLDVESLGFHTKVREGYLALAAADPARFCVVDASQKPDKVIELVWLDLSVLLGIK